MAKKASRTGDEGNITKVEPAGGFLTKVQDDKSLDSMAEFMIVPRLKIVQGSAATELKERFGEGSVIIRPGDAMVVDPDEGGFLFVPHFFFVEYCKWSDYKDKDSNAILDRTFDPTHDVAKRSMDPDKRDEVYEGDDKKPAKSQRFYSYVQHFCWPGVIYGNHPLAGTPVVLSMERGEFGNGRNFITAIQMRRHEVDGERVKVPLWAQVWSLKVSERPATVANSWLGFDFEAQGVITDGEAEQFRDDHLELARLHEENRLRVDHGDEREAAPDDASDDDF